ncbi:DMT family transporter [Arthrobacter sp. PsM3]|uniref:DMT family transporter n=1 Tax=Arthrobacter sp. PsM3 TaxID=3030531 RepID=UPI00263B76CF|nr:multidrug efflux SMR transporter [Arthrobacter sp. PsM3]MDN4645343.1 multidrug efflux SMR transporter [Arthrobacter sp. PsM3]
MAANRMPKSASQATAQTLAWLILLASAVLEAVWATALGLSDGFTRPLPTLVFALTATLSMVGLGLAVRSIPLGTAYAVWVGIGAALTVGWAMATGVEPASPLKLLFIAGIVGCAAGLKLLPAREPVPSPPGQSAPGPGIR